MIIRRPAPRVEALQERCLLSAARLLPSEVCLGLLGPVQPHPGAGLHLGVGKQWPLDVLVDLPGLHLGVGKHWHLDVDLEVPVPACLPEPSAAPVKNIVEVLPLPANLDRLIDLDPDCSCISEEQPEVREVVPNELAPPPAVVKDSFPGSAPKGPALERDQAAVKPLPPPVPSSSASPDAPPLPEVQGPIAPLLPPVPLPLLEEETPTAPPGPVESTGKSLTPSDAVFILAGTAPHSPAGTLGRGARRQGPLAQPALLPDDVPAEAAPDIFGLVSPVHPGSQGIEEETVTFEGEEGLTTCPVRLVTDELFAAEDFSVARAREKTPGDAGHPAWQRTLLSAVWLLATVGTALADPYRQRATSSER